MKTIEQLTNASPWQMNRAVIQRANGEAFHFKERTDTPPRAPAPQKRKMKLLEGLLTLYPLCTPLRDLCNTFDQGSFKPLSHAGNH